MQFTLDEFSKFADVKNVLDESVHHIKEELDHHLDSINQNTQEIQTNYDYLEELNSKIDKLSARMDELSSLFLQNMPVKEKQIQQYRLTVEEKKIFVTLYTAQEPLTYEELATRSALPFFVVEDAITSLGIKQVPIIQKTFAGKTLMVLDEDFKEIQAKHRVVDIQEVY
jgi:chromosome segregation ATPase